MKPLNLQPRESYAKGSLRDTEPMTNQSGFKPSNARLGSQTVDRTFKLQTPTKSNGAGWKPSKKVSSLRSFLKTWAPPPPPLYIMMKGEYQSDGSEFLAMMKT